MGLEKSSYDNFSRGKRVQKHETRLRQAHFELCKVKDGCFYTV